MSNVRLHVFAVVACFTLCACQRNGGYRKTEAMIPMRDGVRLQTEIYVPNIPRGPLPFLINRTPYGWANGVIQSDYLKDLAAEGYIIVLQNVRGRFKSEGRFVMFRLPRDASAPNALDEGTDTYDTIEWLLKNVPGNNGRAGQLGISYGGWLTVMATLDPHPALKAVSEQASPADQFLGDDFHHNGAFRLSYGFEYASMMETDKTNAAFHFDTYDTFDWYLRLGALSNVTRNYGGGQLPSWMAFVEHPNYDAFWQKQAVTPYLTQVKVPNLNVAGWWDQEDFYGPMKIYETLEKVDDKRRNFLVVGPWNHGGWGGGPGRSLGKIDFASDTGVYFREKIKAPWFDYLLKDKGTLPVEEAVTFQTGTNRWESHAQWPPRDKISARNLYFHDSGRLSFDPPAAESDAQFDAYISDPAHPVPYRPRPIEPTYPEPGWRTWLVEDQRFVADRPDVLSWQSDTLSQDLTVTGDIVAHVFASTSGRDSDWIVKLIDVYPQQVPAAPRMGGYQLMIADEVLRARFRHGFERPEPVEPGAVEEYTLDLHANNHTFLRGHRLMVEVQSTWFPVIDRNPQTFVENIWTATDSDYQAAMQRVYRSKRYASHIELPVVVR
jgi:uncharacterized protein